MRLEFINANALKYVVAATIALAGTGCKPAHSDWKADSGAVQHVYLKGVPHTDRNGRRMLKYDPQRSFFPIVIHHAIEMDDSGVKYRLADLTKAGFNCAIAYPGQRQADLSKSANECGLQMIYWKPTPEETRQYLNDPALFGYCMDDELISRLGNDLEPLFNLMQERTRVIKEIDKVHPVFFNDASWITPPATEWWIKLNSWGDISCHDNYPIDSRRTSLSHAQGIPESVSLAVSINKEAKPVWMIAQDHEWVDPVFQCTFPTPAQQRSMVYTAIIHGATGIVEFALDSFVTRAGRVIGISPDPKPKYSSGTIATEDQLRQSRDMWDATAALNAELKELTPAILSPTADIPYEVDLDSEYKPVSKSPIRTLLKTNPDGGYVLLIANIDGAAQHVRVRFPGRTFKEKDLFNEAGASNFLREGDSFEYLCSAYEARAFQIDFD